ncbi:hypothetical protein GCM10022215_07470 [Nocardioides fonticola]|uniref:non-specific serine/threonine protein kinase n=1 Tax=Nocardioides fonticola TaxID=450363 RepID=A0ABP7XCL8_9ACTN
MSVENRRALGSRYHLLERIGSGAMGEVWRAEDRTDGSVVAAKLLRSDLTSDPAIVARFVQERSILVTLRHPRIVRVRDLVVEGDDLAIVMDLVEGADLRHHLRERGTFAPELAVGVAGAVLDALAAAHEAGCLHRDVKPDNVLIARADDLGPDDVRLSDFSIARLAQESTVMATGLLGTPGYMPPELFVHGTFSAASDVYAAGVLLYELLAGRTPFAGPGTAHTVGNRHVAMAPPQLPVPEPLWRALETMLAKDPAQRLPAARTAELLRTLPAEALAGPALPVQPDPTSWTPVGATTPEAGPIHVRETPAGVDVGATFVPRTEEPAAPVARDGEVRPLAPVTGLGGVDAPETMLGRPVEAAPRPVLEPAVAAAPERTRPRWFVPAVALGSVAALGLAAWGLTAVLGGGGGSDTAGSGGPIETVSIADPLPTGLTVTHEATYDPEQKIVDLTIRYGTQSAPLTGPFLEVVPPLSEGQECPGLAWQGAQVTPNIPRATGISVPCAYAITTDPIPAQDSVEVESRISIELPPTKDALDAWLESVVTNTDAALGIQPRTTAYAAQRLSDVVVQISPTQPRVGIGALGVTLLPVWRGSSEPDQSDPLFDSRAFGDPTSMLQQVAGGLSGVRLSDGCSGALTITDGLRVGVSRRADDCQVDARLGNFTDLSSPTFRIESAGG